MNSRWILVPTLLAALACGCIANRHANPVIKNVWLQQTRNGADLVVEKCFLRVRDKKITLDGCKYERTRAPVRIAPQCKRAERAHAVAPGQADVSTTTPAN